MTDPADVGLDRLVRVVSMPAPLRRQVFEALRQSIISGHLAPGERLRERELIDRLGVSRTVIREVFRQLEGQGLIDVHPNRGAIVRKLTSAEAIDLYMIRGVLEGLAARLFTEKAEDKEIQDLRRKLDATVEAYASSDPNTILAVKNKFYEAIFRGARSESLSMMIEALHARIWRWRALGLAHPQRSKHRSTESLDGLRELVEAIAARNSARAESIARQEVEHAGLEVMRLLAEDTSATAVVGQSKRASP